MSTEVLGRVGKRGELYPPKSLREAAGIRPGSKVIFRLVGENLEIEAVPSLEDLLNMESIANITLEEFENYRSELSEKLVKRR